MSVPHCAERRSPEVATVRVAILEDDPGVLRSTVQTLGASARYRLAWQAESLSLARAQLHLPFDLLLLDLGLPDGRGVELIPAARAAAPQAAIVAFTVFDDASNVIEAVEAGVDGYLLKSADAETLLETLASAAAGESPISPAVAGILLRRLRRQESAEPRALPPKQDRLMALTARERDVLEALARGLSYREVAELLGMRVNTVSHHVKNLYPKLASNSRSEAIFNAVREGILRLDP